MSVNRMADDEREIQNIFFEDEGQYAVGQLNIERIEHYEEPGEMGMVPWFAVIKNGKVVYRINGKFVAGVIYKAD